MRDYNLTKFGGFNHYYASYENLCISSGKKNPDETRLNQTNTLSMKLQWRARPGFTELSEKNDHRWRTLAQSKEIIDEIHRGRRNLK